LTPKGTQDEKKCEKKKVITKLSLRTHTIVCKFEKDESNRGREEGKNVVSAFHHYNRTLETKLYKE
jgi:hypothetical protein